MNMNKGVLRKAERLFTFSAKLAEWDGRNVDEGAGVIAAYG